MTRPPDVSIVIPFYDRCRDVQACLQSVLNQDLPPELTSEIVAVDNGSTDGTREELEKYPVRVVDCATRGPGAARNAGIQAARAPIVAVTDSDCVVHRQWLRHLLEPFEDPEVLVSGGRIRARRVDTGPALFAEAFGILNQKRFFAAPHDFPPYFATANAAFRRQALLEAGGFDESLWMCEDADLIWRVLARGGALAYCPRSVVRHAHRETFLGLFRQAVDYGSGAATLQALYRERFGRLVFFDYPVIAILALSPIRILTRMVFGRDSFERRSGIHETVWFAGFFLGRTRTALRHRLPSF